MKKNILKIAAATASAIITLAFLSCAQEGDVYTSTAPKEVTDVKATRIDAATVRLSWTAPIDDNIHAFYVVRTPTMDGLSTVSFFTVPAASGKTYYDFSAGQGFEWQFSVQTVSYDGTYSKPVTVKNSEVLSNSIFIETVQNNPNSVKVYVAVSDAKKVGIEKVCYKINQGHDTQDIISTGTPINPDSDGYYSFDATKDGSYYFAAELSDNTLIKGGSSPYISNISTK